MRSTPRTSSTSTTTSGRAGRCRPYKDHDYRDARPGPTPTAPPRRTTGRVRGTDGWRYQAIATNTRVGQLAFLEARHRAHARVEDRIRQAQDAGLGRLPSKLFAI